MLRGKYQRGGVCSACGQPSEHRTCHVCGESAWVIDCGPPPRPWAPELICEVAEWLLLVNESGGRDGDH
jgi:hypothetical protein